MRDAPGLARVRRPPLMVLIPRYTRYAAPASLIMVKARLEAATRAPTPAATAPTWTSSPSSLPATVISAGRRPRASDRLTINRTLGPGKTMTSRATPAKASNLPGSTGRSIAGAAAARLE